MTLNNRSIRDFQKDEISVDPAYELHGAPTGPSDRQEKSAANIPWANSVAADSRENYSLLPL
jgi:hypothetical protein